MILYYTGTGNSEYVAQRLAKTSGLPVDCINDRIKAGDHSPISIDGPLVVVTPTYSWRIPRLVRDWLLATPLEGASCIYFIMNCGGNIANAGKYNKEIAQALGLEYRGTAQIVMPENYVAMFQVPSEDESKRIVRAADPAIDQVAALIKEGTALVGNKVGLLGRFLSGPVNEGFYKHYIKSEAFHVDVDKCLTCGLCAELCPTNAITLDDTGHPVWGEGCTHCMACICHCPAEAIEYGQKSVGKRCYLCPQD